MSDRITMTEAADLAGVHRNTIRNWAKSGKLTSAVLEDEDGVKVWRIDRDEVEQVAGDKPAPKPVADAPDVLSVMERALAPLMEGLVVLQQQVANAERDRANAEKNQAIAEHESARHATTAAQLKQEVAGLEEQLEEARKRWWKRT